MKLSSEKEVPYPPCYLKNIEKIACIRDIHKKKIYFYNLDTFDLIKSYDQSYGFIGVFLSTFFAFNPNDRQFNCYNKNGELIQSVNTSGLGFNPESNEGTICVTKSKVIVIDSKTNHVVSFGYQKSKPVHAN